jgi:hypothetical protein
MQEFWQGVDTRINAVTKSLIRPYTLAVEDTTTAVVNGDTVNLAKVRLPGEEDFDPGDIPWAPVTGEVPADGDKVLVLVDAYSRRVITGGGGGTTYTIGNGLDQTGSTLTVDPGELQAVGAFSAHATTDQLDLTTSAWTKINYDSQDWDVSNWYDPTTATYTPQIAGKYWLYASQLLTSNTDAGRVQIAFYKNGSIYRTGAMQHTGSTQGLVVAGGAQVEANGTTDAFDARIWHNFATSVADTSANVLYSFSGYFIGTA